MKSKGETRVLLYKFAMYAKIQFQYDIQNIRFDNGNQFGFIELYNKFDIYTKKFVLKLFNRILL